MIRLMLSELTSHRGRRALHFRKEPYWGLIEYGRALGFQKQSRGQCYWVARCRTPDGGYRFHRLGRTNDDRRADGKEVLTYSDARSAASKWFSILEARGVAAPAKAFGRNLKLNLKLNPNTYTVAHAFAEYVEWKKIAASPSYFETLISHGNSYILPLIGDIPAQTLNGIHFREFVKTALELVPGCGASSRPFRRISVERMAPDALRKRKKTINSVITALRSALQMAWDNGLIENDRAFRTFRRFPNTSAPRMLFLNRDECRRLLAAAAPDLRRLILGALYSGCRSSELLGLRVDNIAREGYGLSVAPFKTRPSRFVFLPDEGMAFFLDLVRGRPPSETLFLRSSGSEWGLQHRYYFRLAVAKAELPKEFSFHGLRHTYATQLIQAGVPLQAVADQLGHSNTTTVSRTYSHFAPQIRESEIRQVSDRLIPCSSAGLAICAPSSAPRERCSTGILMR